MNQKVPICTKLFLQYTCIAFINSILLWNICVILLFNITNVRIFQSFLTICHEDHIVFEFLNIIKQFVRHFLHLHSLIIPLLCLFWIFLQSSTEIGIDIFITLLHSLDSCMQTIIHLRISIHDSCTDVERQHSGQH